MRRDNIATPNFADKTIWTKDNLDVLRGMNSQCVDLVYLDPPFNSNQDYSAPVGSDAAGAAFKDTWTLSDVDVAWVGLIADKEPAIANLLYTSKLTHGAGMQSYLTMMAIRLLELHRVLKPTGSIYLHCDPTASHYLKLLMDAVFGAKAFRNEIVWKRSARSDGRRFGHTHDILLAYGPENATWNDVRRAYDPDYLARFYRERDFRGTYKRVDLTGPGTTLGESGAPWTSKRTGLSAAPTSSDRHWSVPRSGQYANWIDANIIPGYKSIQGVHARLDALDKADLIHYPKTGAGQPMLKRYAMATEGQRVNDVFDDIRPISNLAQEKVGYPTQKPLALLERIILASSNEGDLVLDPFCGCATACVAAERLGRKWVGIDISPKAIELVNLRIQKETASIFKSGYVTARTDTPSRTDIEAPVPYRQNKHILFGEQEGLCGGCRIMFPFRNFTIDHVVPVSRGGTDHLDNLQLLCGACNSLKGDRPQEWLIAKLKEAGYGTLRGGPAA